IQRVNGDGVTLGDGWTPATWGARWYRLRLWLRNVSGTQFEWADSLWDLAAQGWDAQVGGVLSGRAGRPLNVRNLFSAAPEGGMSFGHLVVGTGLEQALATPADWGHAGEPAAQRIARLCAEQGVPIS